MTKRQSQAELAEALVPENHVRLLWRTSSGSQLNQITGRLTVVTDDIVHIVPHQPLGSKPRVIHRERVHSAIVTKTGEYTARRRAAAGAHLNTAAVHLLDGDIISARRAIELAAELVPGLSEEVQPCTG